MVVLKTSMTLSDLDKLDEVFAYRTEDGWFIPIWLIDVRNFYLEHCPI